MVREECDHGEEEISQEDVDSDYVPDGKSDNR